MITLICYYCFSSDFALVTFQMNSLNSILDLLALYYFDHQCTQKGTLEIYLLQTRLNQTYKIANRHTNSYFLIHRFDLEVNSQKI